MVAITITDEDGSTRRAFFRGRTRREARAKAEEARRRVAAGAPVRDSERTLAEWLGEWRRIFLRASDRAASTRSLSGLTIRHASLDDLTGLKQTHGRGLEDALVRIRNPAHAHRHDHAHRGGSRQFSGGRAQSRREPAMQAGGLLRARAGGEAVVVIDRR